MSGLLSTADEAKARRRYLVRRGVLLGRPLVGPLEAVVIPTYHCHYRCVFCALESEAPGKKPDMPTATLHRLIDDLAALDAEQVSYTGGGEPLLFPGIDDLVAHTREKGLAASICTNGERLTPERLERFARLGVHLSISLNAATPDLYAKIHPRTKPATFERIVEGLAEYVRLARRGGGDGSFVSLNFVLMNLNFHEIGAMADLGRRIGASQIQYRSIQPRPVHREFFLAPEQMDQVRRAIRAVETEQTGDAGMMVQVMEVLRARPEEDAGDDLVPVPCLEGYVATYVDADGVVFPCCMRATSIANHWMGSLAERSFRDIWHGDAYQAFRRESAGIVRASESADENSCRFCPKAKQFFHAVGELEPGNYAPLYRALAADLAARVAADEADRRRGSPLVTDFRAEFVAHDLPATLRAGERVTANVTVRNAGEQTWPGVERWNAVGLGYHVLSRWKRMARFDNNPRAYLPAALPAGRSVVLPLSVEAPTTPGRYFIELAMIEENVAWFETRGGPTLRVPVRVIG